ncbi:MBL fold metallo-hydrolase [Salisediminibacterium halotolerans]|uniref:MBL fold metallo-hydrolase n=1 Tax=Salisediminibacterium halotolerans TaxID=517425 RepID=UPI000F24AD8D|nr:MBL fold metallo-hydrolase [Salisediminibacterium halotolerans]RLJ78339.1 hydroxyacylglutathione hydrolase [Actinophytocola xinjiangensis]RPE88319.1 hydroxyacylglutathione hydrolase [Salisediminibacterium halotolerans]TWG37315.1 hydroxyacylglutathione hydrolase [Salisediminibacterium halotolerans]GEL09152.1 Zn-dependent hydrolase [Salisediminibacterium halotolerans]
MFLKTFFDHALAQHSYMVGCQQTGEAAVIDPSRNVDEYFDVAEEEELTITRVLETHIHADYVSGSREMAERASATIYYSREGEGDPSGEYNWDNSLSTHGLRDGDKIQMGKVSLDVLHTPGHTPEHISFILTDGAASDKPIGMFTGDFLFVGDVGRPDLLEKAVGVQDSAKKGAKQMFASLKKIADMDPSLQIWPGHGAGSACGKSLGAVPTSSLGYELKTNPALQHETEESFVDFLLAEQPTPPAYFAVMKRINKTGPQLLRDAKSAYRYGANVKKIDELLQRDVTVIDARSRESYAQSHIPGTINIPFDSTFANWMGSLVSYEKPVFFIAEPHTFDEIKHAMNAIGLDQTEGFFSPMILDQYEAAYGTSDYPVHTPKTAYEKQRSNELNIVDVREEYEYEKLHVDGAYNMVMNDISERHTELPSGPIAVYCGSGARSAIAASLLKEKGFDVRNIKGGFMRWRNEELPTSS